MKFPKIYAQILLSFLISLLISCGKNSDGKNSKLKRKEEQVFLSFKTSNQELLEFDLDTMTDFQDILSVIEEIDCLKHSAVFKFENDNKIFKIQPLRYCEAIFDYKLKEILYINTDSIIVNYEIHYPIDSLKLVLNNHLININLDENYALPNEKRLISINVDKSKNISETKRLLLRIFEAFNDLNIDTNFYFLFEENGIIQNYP